MLPLPFVSVMHMWSNLSARPKSYYVMFWIITCFFFNACIMEFARDTRRATLRSALANICVTACWIYRWKKRRRSSPQTIPSSLGSCAVLSTKSLLMLRWSADKVLPQKFQLLFDGRGLGVRCYEPHPGVNGCASVASPFIWPCEPQNASVTWFWFLCALLRTAQKAMIVLHTCEKTSCPGSG